MEKKKNYQNKKDEDFKSNGGNFKNGDQKQDNNKDRNEVVEYSLKRVMKNLNNYILNEY